MIKVHYIVYLLFFLLVSACTEVRRTGIDYKKASLANSELGVAYLRQGKNKIAMNKLKKALRFDIDNGNAHHYIAELYRRLEQNELADEHYNIAIDLNEEDSSIKNNYGIFLCSTGLYEKGLSFFNEALNDPLYENKGAVYENMGLCAAKQGNIRYAEKYFEVALKFNKRLPAALLGLAKIKYDGKDIKTSDRYLKRYYKVAKHTAESIWLELLIARKRGLKGYWGSLAIKLREYYPDSTEVELLKKMQFH